MAKTYEQIQQQIEKLQRQAKALQAVEAQGVIDRIKEAIRHYSLTAEQLGFDAAKPATSAAMPTSLASSEPAKKQVSNTAPRSAGKGKAQFSDESGNVWGGRGPRPAWLRAALASGHDINEFRIGRRAKSKVKATKTAMPLSAAIAAASSSTDSSASPAAGAAAPADSSVKRAKTGYTDGAGHTWSGMGPKPGWLKAAIAAGKSLADFAT